MQMFIANCTLQNRIINFRLPEVLRNIQQTIAPMSQVRAGRANLSQPDIDYIVEQLSLYGLCDIQKLRERRATHQQIPTVYSIDVPVPIKIIADVQKHNKGTLRKLGEKTRTEAAIASATYLEREAPGTLRVQDIIVQEESGGTLHTDDDPTNIGMRTLGSRATNQQRDSKD